MQVLEIHVTELKDKNYVEVYADYGYASKVFNMDKRPAYKEEHYIADAMPAISVWLRNV